MSPTDIGLASGIGVLAVLFTVFLIHKQKRRQNVVSTDNPANGLPQNLTSDSPPPANAVVDVPPQTESFAFLGSRLQHFPPHNDYIHQHRVACVTNDNPDDRLPQKSVRDDPPPANLVVGIPPQSESLALLASGLPHFHSSSGRILQHPIIYVTNDDAAGSEQPENSKYDAPTPVEDQDVHTRPPRPASNLATRRLLPVLSLNNYILQQPSSYFFRGDPPTPVANLTTNAPPMAGQLISTFSPGCTNPRLLQNLKCDDVPSPSEVLPLPALRSPISFRRPSSHSKLASSSSIRDFSGTIFDYKELEKATNGFSAESFLGSGAFGDVYRGTMSNGTYIAVKRLKPDSQRQEKEFQAEVDTISHIRHINLVSMVGCCISGEERMLVYDFVPNNTLHFHLHGDGQPTLDWPTRVKIALGSASGLAYLHEDCDPRIIHRDIKAPNILLDYEFNAKELSGKLTEKSDVYSFGVMLLELITGRKPKGLALWAKGEAPDSEQDYEKLVDPRLERHYNIDEMVRMVACAAACLRKNRRLRPSMSQVVRLLKQEGSLEELNEGINQFWDNVIGRYDGDVKAFWKNAFVSPNNSPTSWSMPATPNSPN